MKVSELPEDQWRRWVMKKLKALESVHGEQWQAINDFDENTRGLADEATNHAARAQRAVRRLKKDFEEHDHDD